MFIFLIVSYFIIVGISYIIFKDHCRYLSNRKYIYLIGITRSLGLIALFFRFFYYYEWSASFLGDMLLFIVSFYLINFILSIFFVILRKLFKHQKRFHGSESIMIISIVSFIICGFGVQQAVDFQTKNYTIHTNKQLHTSIALLSDLHLGNSLRKTSLHRLLTIVTQSDVDALMITGDLFDESTAIKDMENFIEEIKQLSLPIYYVQGNHEYLSHYRDKFYTMLTAAGIHNLEDESVLTKEGYYIIGRKDRNYERQSLRELTASLDQKRFMLVLDHQPVEDDVQVDLQLSGHTHNGQIVPINFITAIRYPLLYGYNEENYPIIVTSGAGTWGFPMRIGTQSEIVIIKIDNA